MLKLSVTFAAFFISLGRILWVSDDHCPKTWASYACDNSRTLPQTPAPLTLQSSSRVVGGTPLVFIRPFISQSAWERRTQGAGAAGMGSRQSRGGEGLESRDSSAWREVQLSRRRSTVHFAKPLDLLIFECPNQNHSLQDSISLSPCQTKQPNISISFVSASPSSCFAADQWTWAGW